MMLFKNILRKEQDMFIPPKNAQDVIPINTIYKDGIFLSSKNLYSKCYRFSDINYAVASRDDKEVMFLQYSELLNSLDVGSTSKITLVNRRVNKDNFNRNILIPLNNDKLDLYRNDYNKMLMSKVLNTNSIIQEKYITISINKKNIEEARNYFNRIDIDLKNHFNELGSRCIELNAEDRIRLIHDIYRIGEENIFNWNMLDDMRKGKTFKDYVCPDSFSFEDDYFEIGNKYGRVFFLKNYANYIKDSMIAELAGLNKDLLLSIDINPVSLEEAIKEAEKRRLGVETNITNWQRRQNANNNFSAVIPYDLEQQRQESTDFLNDLTARDQRMFESLLTFTIISNTKDELESDTESLLSIVRKHMCQLGILKFQQMDGLNTCMPIGVKKIKADRTLTTESLSVLHPFNVQDIIHSNGIYYGENVISKNMIIADRRELLNGNSFIMGVSGSGKSFAAKNEIVSIALRDPNADIIIIDPEKEYAPLVKALEGEVINISSTSNNHINAMDINSDYGDGANPIILKSEFILSLCERIVEGINLSSKEKSLIDRCVANVYKDYQQSNYKGEAPTLSDLSDELSKQPEPEGKQIALSIERYSKGTLDTFAKKTNVNTNSRILCYDILELGEQLLPVGMLVVLDSILNRITINRTKGRRTYIFIDEIYLLFKYEYSANFLFTLWKRVRKYGAYCTGITQNVDDLLQSHTARTMLANSEFLILLNQASTDKAELAKILKMSETQTNYMTNVGIGEGILKIGSSLVPFKNVFPKDSELYKLMTTKPGE